MFPQASAGDEVHWLPFLTKDVQTLVNDSFCFIITSSQQDSFHKWIVENHFEAHVVDTGMTRPCSNALHLEIRNCQLFVLMHPEHWYRQLAKDDPEITEDNFINYVNWPSQCTSISS